MAGTLFGLPLSQRVDLNGLPSIGWLLYIYQANTSTPVQSYQDTALTVLNPWPIAADSTGMIGQFWLADGSYRARATNSDGSLTYFDQQSILALGASSGAAPSGGVDANAIFQTGDVMWLDRSGTRPGWVRDNGRTIGSAISGAAERSNADCQPLFEYLWNNFDNTRCPVVTGRGASSLNDWLLNKQLTLPDKRGCGMIGIDDMGNVPRFFFGDIPFNYGSSIIASSLCGHNSHILTPGELPAHTHAVIGTTGIQSADHTHTEQMATAAGGFSKPPSGLTTGTLQSGNTQTLGQSNDHTHGVNLTSDNGPGISDTMCIVQQSLTGTFFRKL